MRIGKGGRRDKIVLCAICRFYSNDWVSTPGLGNVPTQTFIEGNLSTTRRASLSYSLFEPRPQRGQPMSTFLGLSPLVQWRIQDCKEPGGGYMLYFIEGGGLGVMGYPPKRKGIFTFYRPQPQFLNYFFSEFC